MATDERNRLHNRLTETIDDEPATTLMELLPTVPNIELLTQRQAEGLLGNLENRLLGAMDRRFAVQTRVFVFAMIANSATLVGVVLAVR